MSMKEVPHICFYGDFLQDLTQSDWKASRSLFEGITGTNCTIKYIYVHNIVLGQQWTGGRSLPKEKLRIWTVSSIEGPV